MEKVSLDNEDTAIIVNYCNSSKFTNDKLNQDDMIEFLTVVLNTKVDDLKPIIIRKMKKIS